MWKNSKIHNLKHLQRNKLDKGCFDSDGKDLAEITILNKVLKGRANNLRNDGYQRALASMVYKFLIKSRIRAKASVNEKLSQELHKPVIKKTQKQKRVYARFKENNWAVDLDKMG